MGDPPRVAGSSPRDVDFLFGSWRVANERLRTRLAGADAIGQGPEGRAMSDRGHAPASRARRPQATACCPVLELRQYALHRGQRDALIDLFDREFVESQEAVGMRLVGQFRDLDNPDRFVWLRGFADMPSRAAALAAFYGGPVWAAHRDEANATMVAWDDVLLLRPATPTSGFALAGVERPPQGAPDTPSGVIAATVCFLAAPADDALLAECERVLRQRLAEVDAALLGVLVTEPSPNSFPALPIREGEHVVVWFARSPDPLASIWQDVVVDPLVPHMARPPERLRLSPTPRSLLRTAGGRDAADGTDDHRPVTG